MKKMFTVIVVLVSMMAEAKLELGAPFRDHAVLQRDCEVRIWGTADPGAMVEVRFAGQVKTAVASTNGAWRVTLDPMPASKDPRDLTVVEVKSKSEEVRSKDVLVGEVWICSGQSNCDCPIWGGNCRYRDGQGAMTVQMTVKPFVRLAKIDKVATAEPRMDVPVKWRRMMPKELTGDVSAMGYYYALELANALDIPIGIIDCSWGGSRIEPWTPRCGFASVEGLEKERDWQIIDKETHKANPKACPYPWDNQPRMMWNGLVAALAPMSMRGMLWYQGCSNAGAYGTYTKMLHALYNGWKTEFENPGLRFYYVQLAPWGNPVIPHIQEAQARFAAEEPNAAIAVINDIGNLHDIHPNDKRTVARRLALHALKRDYGYDWIKDNSPTLKSWKVEKGKFVLSFNDAESWYVYNTDGSVQTGFEVAGTNGVWKTAKIDNLAAWKRKNGSVWYPGHAEGKDLVVGSEEVPEPVRLRYLYAKPWFGCLYNEVNLPLGAFHIETP